MLIQIIIAYIGLNGFLAKNEASGYESQYSVLHCGLLYIRDYEKSDSERIIERLISMFFYRTQHV